MIRRILFYCFVLSIPVFLGLTAWQSSRYGDLERELKKLEKTQEEWVENNKRLIAGITYLSSPDRIEHIAREQLGLHKKQPEEVLQISITDPSVVSDTVPEYSAGRTDVGVSNEDLRGSPPDTVSVPDSAYRSIAEYFEGFEAANE
ncbi:MAG: septum formation initiator family protein [Treponema sp.]|nr:septum formation initiator family protein [Treponema sp.]